MEGESIESLFGPGGTYAEDDSVGCNASPLFGCPGMPRGISIWEGEINDAGGTQEETGFNATGSYRRPTLDEMTYIVEGVSPWTECVDDCERRDRIITPRRLLEQIVHTAQEALSIYEHKEDVRCALDDINSMEALIIEVRKVIVPSTACSDVYAKLAKAKSGSKVL
jgi:hypothetical protein